MKNKKSRIPAKSLAKRVFFLNRAMNKAKSSEFKELWKKKRKELLRIYNK